MRIFLTILISVNLAFSQGPLQQKESWRIGFSGDYATIDRVGKTVTAGFNAEFMINRYVGLQATVTGGQDAVAFSGIFGLIPFFIVLGESNDSDLKSAIQIIQLLFWLAAVESPAFHMPMGERVDFSIYASFFRARYIWKDDETLAMNGWYASHSLGMRLTFLLGKNWIASAYAESTQLYYSGRPRGYQTGISIGWLLYK